MYSDTEDIYVSKNGFHRLRGENSGRWLQSRPQG